MQTHTKVSRRAILATAGGLAAAAAITGEADAAKKRSRGREGLDDNPDGWGEPGDKTFYPQTRGAGGFSGTFSSNCDDRMDEIRSQFDVYAFGSCDHPSPVDADVEAAEKMIEVIANGGVFNTEFGHRTVQHKAGPVSYNTYLAYAAGDESP